MTNLFAVISTLVIPAMIAAFPLLLILIVGSRNPVSSSSGRTIGISMLSVVVGLVTPIMASYACGFALYKIDKTPEGHYYTNLISGATVFFPLGYCFTFAAFVVGVYFCVRSFRKSKAVVTI